MMRSVISTAAATDLDETIATELLNVSGKKFDRNPAKTIWSYSPEDFSIKSKMIKRRCKSCKPVRLKTRSRRSDNVETDMKPNSKILSDYFLAQLCDENTNSAKSFQNNEKQNLFYYQNDDKTKHENKNLITIDSFNYSIERVYEMKPNSKPKSGLFQNPMSSTSTGNLHDNSEPKNTADKPPNRAQGPSWSCSNYKSILSKLIRDRYTTEAVDRQVSELRGSTQDDQQPPQDQIYSHHVDSLIPDVLASLSDGIGPGLNAATTITNTDYMDDIDIYDDDLESDQDDEENELKYELVSAENDEDYEDRKIILETNIVRNRTDDKHLVMKICNGIQSSSQLLEAEPKRSTGKRANSKLGLRKSKTSPANFSNEMVDHENPTNQRAVYDYIRDYDYEYEYTDVINDELRRVLDRYDGSTSADAYFRQNLPSMDQYMNVMRRILDDPDKDEQEFDEQKKNKTIDRARESYLMLKRMLVKKKYVLATLKVEKEIANRRCKSSNRKSGTSKSRPVTATSGLAPGNSETKIARPKTVNVIPVKPVVSEDTFYLEENTKGEEKPTEAKTNKTECESYYEPYQLASSSSLCQQNWPFELDFEISSKQQQQTKPLKQPKSGNETNKSTSTKCYPCKKLPVVQKANSPAPKVDSQPRIVVTPAANNLQSQTYCSTRRTISAKLKPAKSFQQFRPTTIVADADIQDSDYMTDKRKVEVNKEEQMRRMNIIPGRTFRSQRTKSISVEHVPPSRKKLDTQMRRVLLTAKNSETKTSQAQVDNPGQTVEPVSRRGSSRGRNLALALQHHEEIFSLVRNKDKSGQIKLDLTNRSADFVGSFSSSGKFDELAGFFNNTGAYSICSTDNNERPKTSKV